MKRNVSLVCTAKLSHHIFIVCFYSLLKPLNYPDFLGYLKIFSILFDEILNLLKPFHHMADMNSLGFSYQSPWISHLPFIALGFCYCRS
jgi:hypothetical protein